MKTNLVELVESFKTALSGDFYEQTEVIVTSNDKKAENGNASVTICVKVDEDKMTTGTIYISEKEKSVLTMFVNDRTHDLVFSNTSSESVSKAQTYIKQYFERSTKRMLGIEITDGSKPKRPNKKSGRQ